MKGGSLVDVAIQNIVHILGFNTCRLIPRQLHCLLQAPLLPFDNEQMGLLPICKNELQSGTPLPVVASF